MKNMKKIVIFNTRLIFLEYISSSIYIWVWQARISCIYLLAVQFVGYGLHGEGQAHPGAGAPWYELVRFDHSTCIDRTQNHLKCGISDTNVDLGLW